MRETFRSTIGGYLDRIGLGRELALPLAALAWAQLALRKVEQLDGGRLGSFSRCFPLVLLEEGRCLNLELLAERRDSWCGGTARAPGGHG